MINNLSLLNFKGVSRDYAFTPANYVHGRNFSGKSAIDQAIRCLVLGYVPEQAKTAAAMKMFASGYPMKIAMALSGIQARPLEIGFEKVKSTVKQTADSTLSTTAGRKRTARLR